jgi:hypothetical protein
MGCACLKSDTETKAKKTKDDKKNDFSAKEELRSGKNSNNSNNNANSGNVINVRPVEINRANQNQNRRSERERQDRNEVISNHRQQNVSQANSHNENAPAR